MGDWTPGPWTIEGEDAVYAGETAVAAYRYCYPEGAVPLEEADARLIAAAPEMAELLEELNKEWSWDDEVLAPQSPVVPKARALLARIESG
jgi:hypothetical protein